MSEQLHITHRSDYLRGRQDGATSVLAGAAYLPGELRILHGDTDGQKAYRLGYADGWADANPCDNGTCDHLAHRNPVAS